MSKKFDVLSFSNLDDLKTKLNARADVLEVVQISGTSALVEVQNIAPESWTSFVTETRQDGRQKIVESSNTKPEGDTSYKDSEGNEIAKEDFEEAKLSDSPAKEVMGAPVKR